MTVEASNPSASYTISGTGPYALLWPYFADGFAVYVEDAGTLVELTALDYSAAPVSSTVSGNLFLDPAIAVTHAGKKLYISRLTAAEQGWQGTQGEREYGLEVQLDRLTMNAQEQAVEILNTLRIIGGSGEPLAPVDQATFYWDATLRQFLPGPSVAQIILDLAASAANAALASTKAAESVAARDAALVAFANFRDVFLGAFAADPATDIDGSALEPGDLYFSTTANVMRVYTGSAWVNAYVSADGVVLTMNNLSDIASKPAALTTLRGYNTTATAGSTTTLTAASALTQVFTGTQNQTVALPDPATLALGWEYEIPSRTTGLLTVNSSGANLIGTIPAGLTARVKCVLASGSTAASWAFSCAQPYDAQLTDLATPGLIGTLKVSDGTNYDDIAAGTSGQVLRGVTGGKPQFETYGRVYSSLITTTGVATLSSAGLFSGGNIPANAQRIGVCMLRMSVSTTSYLAACIGDAASFLVTGYQSRSTEHIDTSNHADHFTGTGFIIGSVDIAGDFSGDLILDKLPDGSWLEEHQVDDVAARYYSGRGRMLVENSGGKTMDRIRLSVSAGTFDATRMYFWYET